MTCNKPKSITNYLVYSYEVEKVGEFKIESVANITEVTENAYAYPQLIFADEDKCLEVLSRKWALPIFRNLITRETVIFKELKKLIPDISSKVLSDTLVELEHQ